MICYIKSIKDFKTVEKYDIIEYSISDGEDGTVKVATNVSAKEAQIYSGCWMIIPFMEEDNEIPYTLLSESNAGGSSVDITGKDLKIKENILPGGGIEYIIDSRNYSRKMLVYYISECSPDSSSLVFTIQHPIYAFSRRLLYTGETTWGDLISKAIRSGFDGECQDRNFAMPYILVQGGSTTECYIETDDYGYYVPSDYFEYARKIGINIDFSVKDNTRLLVSISNASQEYGTVLFNDGHSQLKDETYASNKYSKVTVLQKLDTVGPVIGRSDISEIEAYNSSIFVEVAQDIANSYVSKKSMLLVRIVSYWSGAESEIAFKNCALVVKLTSSSGTSLLNTTFEWTIKTDPGYATSDWFALSQLDEVSTCKLYVSIVPDRYPNETEAQSYSTFIYTINVNDIVARSAIQFGPLDSNYNQIMYRVLDYYLSSTGSISTTVPAELADGEWIVIDANSDETPYDQAADIFQSNSDNHKIEFYSDQYFEYYQPIRMRIRSGVFETIVTSRTMSSSDYRYYYKCGRLLTRITEKVKALTNQKG